MMNVVLLGNTGMLGRDLEAALLKQPLRLFTCSRTTSETNPNHFVLDLEDPDFDALVSWSRPDALIHCAAMTNVDECEKNKERAEKVNVGSVAGILSSLGRLASSASFIYISSDAVKAEDQPMASEGCRVAPLNFYGETKAAAERLIQESELNATAVRTTIVGTRIGIGQNSFVDWVISSLKSGKQTNLFEDALFTPISTQALSKQLISLLGKKLPKILHLDGATATSKYDFGFELAKKLGLDTSLIVKSNIARSGLLANRLKDQTLSSAYAERHYLVKAPSILETIQDVCDALKLYETKGLNHG